jgi:transposase-like protein
VKQGWRDIKDRRAEKRNGVAHEEAELIVAAAVEQVLEEDHAPMPRGRASSLTPEQEAEIINLYTTTDQPVVEIARAYGIPETGPFRVLAKNNVSWRRGDSPGRVLPPHIEAMKEVHVAPAPTPAPQQSPSIDQAQTKRDDALIGVIPEPPLVMQEALAEAFDKVFPSETLPRWTPCCGRSSSTR